MQFQHLTCPHCVQPLFFPNADYKGGLRIECPSCQNAFNQLNCPSDNESHVWMKGDYSEGGAVVCSACKKSFQHLNCPHCQASNFYPGGYHEGIPQQCKACTRSFQQLTCPHCLSSNQWPDCNYIPGATVTCTTCDKAFQQLNCAHCSSSNQWPKADYCEGTTISCHTCKRPFVQLKCPRCFASNDIKTDYIPGMVISCSGCQELFQQITCQHCFHSNVWKDANLKPHVKSACHNCDRPIEIDPKCLVCVFAVRWLSYQHADFPANAMPGPQPGLTFNGQREICIGALALYSTGSPAYLLAPETDDDVMQRQTLMRGTWNKKDAFLFERALRSIRITNETLQTRYDHGDVCFGSL
jgi:hypothetical protein